MKEVNIPRIVWVSCLFLELVIILVMVMNYKINYQYFSSNNLYFYDCNGSLCVGEKTSSKKIYSVFPCGTDSCPVYRKVIEENYAILDYSDMSILFNYKDNKVISRGYDDYDFINSNYIVVTRRKKKGVINISDEITVDLSYEEIGYKKDDYITGYGIDTIIAKKNSKYGIISFKDGTIIEDFKYSDDKMGELLDIIKRDSDVSV